MTDAEMTKVCPACRKDTEPPEWWTKDEWATPQDVFDEFNRRLGPFTLDVCARVATAKVAAFYTKADDALTQPWTGVVWCNPPYSNPAPWCEKAATEVAIGNATRVVMLLPNATDTGWFHEFVIPYAEIELLPGRIAFIGWRGEPERSPRAGNILAVYPKR